MFYNFILSIFPRSPVWKSDVTLVNCHCLLTNQNILNKVFEIVMLVCHFLRTCLVSKQLCNKGSLFSDGILQNERVPLQLF